MPVTVAGLTVQPGDLVHADRHGAVVVPHSAAAQLADAAARIARQEATLIDASKQPGFGVEVLEQILTGGGGQH